MNKPTVFPWMVDGGGLSCSFSHSEEMNYFYVVSLQIFIRKIKEIHILYK